jgi:hypothetical protein
LASGFQEVSALDQVANHALSLEFARDVGMVRFLARINDAPLKPDRGVTGGT